MRRTFVALLVILGIVLPTYQPAFAADPLAQWPTAAPEEYGIDSAKLAGVLLNIRDEVPTLHSFLLIRDGKVLVNASFYPYDGSTPHDVASVTKSVTTTLIGIAVDQGSLWLDQPVLSFFPDYAVANRDERKERMTLADLAGMTSGLGCVLEPNEPQLQAMLGSDDWIQFALDLPMVAEPGSRWDYCSPGMHLLSAILTRATGMTALDFAWANLFGPLGMREVIWPADQQGVTRGWGDLMLYPQDMAKLGQLWLNGGVWNGRQIVSSAWLEAAATARATTTVDGADYGYGWWITRESSVGGEFSARGRGGQYVVVFPALNAVAVMTGGGSYGPSDVTDLLAPALVNPTKALPANPAGVEQLTETVASLRAAPAPRPVPSLPQTAAAISGTTYAFEANPLGLDTLRLTFDHSAEARLELTFLDGSRIDAAVGLDGVFRFTPGEYGFPTGLRGAWLDDQTFGLEYAWIANIDTYTVRLGFEGESLLFEATESSIGATVSLMAAAAS